MRCERQLACGHQTCKNICSVPCSTECDYVVPITCKRGHISNVKCYQQRQPPPCEHECPEIRACGHPCKLRCGVPCESQTCNECVRIQKEAAKKLREERQKYYRELAKKITTPEQFQHPPIVDSQELKQLSQRLAPYAYIHGKSGNVMLHIARAEKVINHELLKNVYRNWSELKDPTQKPVTMFIPCKNRQEAEKIADTGVEAHTVLHDYIAFDSDMKQIILLECDVMLGNGEEVTKVEGKKFLGSKQADSVYVANDASERAIRVRSRLQVMPCNIIYCSVRDVAFPKPTGDGQTRIPEEQAALDRNEYRLIQLPEPRGVEGSAAERHYRTAESQFLRLTRRFQLSIVKIFYAVNPSLMRQFEAKKCEFDKRYGPDGHRVTLGFHGTAQTNIDPICRNNFDISRLSRNSGDKGWYGAGIYFSEKPLTSLGYAHNATQLLLCLVLTGKPYRVPGRMDGASLKAGYDSHLWNDGEEIVIFHSDQILPCYVIEFKQ